MLRKTRATRLCPTIISATIRCRLVVVVGHRHIADRELLLILYNLIVDRNKILQQSTQRPLVGIRRLHAVLQIGKAGLACPGMGVVKIRAVIQSAALEDRLIIFLADDDRLHRHDTGKVRMIMGSG